MNQADIQQENHHALVDVVPKNGEGIGLVVQINKANAQ
jgi:hypothetical protein